MRAWVWILNRTLGPLVIAAMFLILRWGRDNMFYIIALPAVVLIWRMATSESQKSYEDRSRIGHWYASHTAEVLSLLLLMCFEIAVASLAQAKVEALFVWSVVGLSSYVPYLALTIWAKILLISGGSVDSVH